MPYQLVDGQLVFITQAEFDALPVGNIAALQAASGGTVTDTNGQSILTPNTANTQPGQNIPATGQPAGINSPVLSDPSAIVPVEITGLNGAATGEPAPVDPVDYGNLQDFGGAGASDFQIAEGRATPGSTPGVGSSAEGDGAANTRQVLATFNKKVFLPKDNVLDQYASYTYNIGWYLMSPANYKELLKTKKPNIANYSLLAQSGGAPTGTTPSDAGGARNQFFGLDYYIDDLEITSVVSGKGGKRAHNAQEITFKVTEPAGITLINNIQKAVASVYKNDMKYSLAVFCLVIRFYGYDENSKIVSARNSENKDAIVEKFIPFYISNVSFRIANKIVEYDVKATPVVYHVGFGTQSGTIKAPIEITGSTVSQILNGNGTDNNSVSADDGRVDVPSPNTTQSSLQGSSDFYG